MKKQLIVIGGELSTRKQRITRKLLHANTVLISKYAAWERFSAPFVKEGGDISALGDTMHTVRDMFLKAQSEIMVASALDALAEGNSVVCTGMFRMEFREAKWADWMRAQAQRLEADFSMLWVDATDTGVPDSKSVAQPAPQPIAIYPGAIRAVNAKPLREKAPVIVLEQKRVARVGPPA